MGNICQKESAKAGTVYRAYKFSTFLLQPLPVKAAKPSLLRTTISLPSQRISQVIHRACLEKETCFTPSHTANVTWPTGMTESLSVDLSVHQSASYLHWNVPVNKWALASPVLFSFYQGRCESEVEGPLVKVIESFLARAGFRKLVTLHLILM